MSTIDLRRSLRNDGLPRWQQGIAAIEFAVVFSVFFTILYGLVTYGAVFYTQQAVSRAAEDGARAMSLLPPAPAAFNDAPIKDVIANSLSTSLIAPITLTSQAQRKTWLSDPLNVTITVTPACLVAGVSTCVNVTVQYHYSRNQILPSLPLMTVPATLAGRATVRT